VLLLKPQNGQTEALSDAFVPHSGQYTNPILHDLLGKEFMLKPYGFTALPGFLCLGTFGLAYLLPYSHSVFRKAAASFLLYHRVRIIFEEHKAERESNNIQKHDCHHFSLALEESPLQF